VRVFLTYLLSLQVNDGNCQSKCIVNVVNISPIDRQHHHSSFLCTSQPSPFPHLVRDPADSVVDYLLESVSKSVLAKIKGLMPPGEKRGKL